MGSNTIFNPFVKTRRQIIQTLEEDAERRIGDDHSPIQIQHRNLTIATGYVYHDRRK